MRQGRGTAQRAGGACIDTHMHMGTDALNRVLNGADFADLFAGNYGPESISPGEIETALDAAPSVRRAVLLPQPWTAYLDIKTYLSRGYWQHWRLQPEDVECVELASSGEMRFPYERENEELWRHTSSRTIAAAGVAPDRLVAPGERAAYRTYLRRAAERSVAFKYHPRGLGSTIREIEGGTAVRVAIEAGKPLLVHTTVDPCFHAWQACQLARRCSGLTVVACHAAGFSSRCWAAMAELPNLYADSSALEIFVAHRRYYAEDALIQFGATPSEALVRLARCGKLVWGTDHPWVANATGLEYADQVGTYLALPPRTRDAIEAATAAVFGSAALGL